MMIIVWLAAIASVVCWILVLIKMFPAEGPLKGILAIICGLYAFIWGWMNAARFNLRNIMIAWTIAIIVSVIANVLGGGAALYQ
jgi:hypothetical protein